MDKVTIIINDPESCFYCPLARQSINGDKKDRYVCSIGHQGEYSFVWVYEPIDMDYSKAKPSWCPLKPAPNKVEMPTDDWDDGWNACVDAILADNKGWTTMVEDYLEQHKT